jgi:hypothetical protein
MKPLSSALLWNQAHAAAVEYGPFRLIIRIDIDYKFVLSLCVLVLVFHLVKIVAALLT